MVASGWSILAEEFRKNGTLISYRKEEIVIRPEIQPPGVFYLETGYMKVYKLTKGGNENITNFKRPGNLLPVLWSITGESREHYFQAITDISVYRLDRENYLKFLETHPGSMREALNRLVWLHEEYADRIHCLEFRYASERIAYHLLSLAKRYGKKKGKTRMIMLPITQTEIADSINATRETASKELVKLKKKGLIDYQDSHYVIKDEKTLKTLY